MKQETLEETAEEYYVNNIFCDGITEFEHDIAIRCYIAGAKNQAERMYSEEDLRKAFIAGGNSQIEEDDAYGSAYIEYMEEYFEQFKKK
jgi:hypothetical protein